MTRVLSDCPGSNGGNARRAVYDLDGGVPTVASARSCSVLNAKVGYPSSAAAAISRTCSSEMLTLGVGSGGGASTVDPPDGGAVSGTGAVRDAVEVQPQLASSPPANTKIDANHAERLRISTFSRLAIPDEVGGHATAPVATLEAVLDHPPGCQRRACVLSTSTQEQHTSKMDTCHVLHGMFFAFKTNAHSWSNRTGKNDDRSVIVPDGRTGCPPPSP